MNRRTFCRQTSAGVIGATLASNAGSLLAAGAKSSDKLACLGGTPIRTRPFPTQWPIFDEREERALLDALRSGNWCCLRGHAVYDFEKLFAEAMGAGSCVLSNGGTTALSTALNCMGVGAGDEVITTPHTFVATINVITNCHALPVFVDIDPETGSIDAELIEAAITDRTKAILPVHLGGWPADIEKIMTVADKHGIPVVEDACQSVFAEVNGRKIGTWGQAGCISFQEWKTLVCGEGGALLGKDAELMRRCAAYVNNGRDPRKEIGGYPFPGSNHRMTEFQAALLNEQFRRFKEHDLKRQENGRYVEEAVCRIPGLTMRKRYSPNTRVTYFRFEVDYDRRLLQGVPAAKFAEALQAEGFPVSGGPRVHGRGCHREGMLDEHLNSRGFKTAFSKARLDDYRKSLNLPVMDNKTGTNGEMLYGDMKIAFLGTRAEMDDLIAAFQKVARNASSLRQA